MLSKTKMATAKSRRRPAPTPSFGSRFTYLPVDDLEFPSIKKTKSKDELILTNSFFNKSQKLSDLIAGPKFVVIKRREENESLTLRLVNPFLIEKAIEQQAGTVKSILRVRDGSILIETVSKKQAEKLYKMTTLGPNINVSIFEHPRLNSSKAVVSCFDFTFLTDKEILEGLASQHVTEIKRITRRIPNKKERVNSASIIITFNLPQLPEKIHVAFQSISVRPFIPRPLRCFNCQEYGHGSTSCAKPSVCGKCSSNSHPKTDECKNTDLCTNCGDDHPSWSSKCPTFVKESEIQRIKTVERVTYYEARKQYSIRFPMNDIITSKKNETNKPPVDKRHIEKNTTFSNIVKNIEDNNKIIYTTKTNSGLSHLASSTTSLALQKNTDFDLNTYSLPTQTTPITPTSNTNNDIYTTKTNPGLPHSASSTTPLVLEKHTDLQNTDFNLNTYTLPTQETHIPPTSFTIEDISLEFTENID